MRKIAILVAVFLVIGSIPGWSVCGPVDDWITKQADSTNYPVKFVGLLLSGVHRAVEAPFEVLYHSYDGTRNRFENGLGFFTGLGEGMFRGIESIGRGAVDVLSAPVPGYNGMKGGHDHRLVK